ncbi:MAG: Tim44/TimA family putative adaptor protein [Magnetospirillum sp. WYHS-4]
MQAFDIILFALIAVFLALRLRSVLGKRDGHEGGFPDPFRKDRNPEAARDDESASSDNVIPLPGRKAARVEDVEEGPEPEPRTPLEIGLAAIRTVDGDFSAAGMLGGARVAFEMILNAFAAADLDTLKGLLSPEVFENFAQSIRERQKAGHVLDATLVGIRGAELTEASLEGRMAQVTIRFVSEQVTVTRDADGKVVEGDPNLVVDVVDFWTFARDTRSRDPNWTLVATQSPE